MNDEQEIRALIATWMKATAAGEIDTILDLMSEDAVYLLAGQPPMRGRAAFATGFRSALEQVRIEGTADIQEIGVFGDMAYCWNRLALTITPRRGGPATRREGPVLTVFRKEAGGRWRLFRDANLLTAI